MNKRIELDARVKEVETLRKIIKDLMEENYSLNKEIELLSADLEKMKHENYGLKQTIRNQERKIDKFTNASLGR